MSDTTTEYSDSPEEVVQDEEYGEEEEEEVEAINLCENSSNSSNSSLSSSSTSGESCSSSSSPGSSNVSATLEPSELNNICEEAVEEEDEEMEEDLEEEAAGTDEGEEEVEEGELEMEEEEAEAEEEEEEEVDGQVDSIESSEEEEEDSFELAQIGNEVFSLPRGLCENSAIFYEFFSLDTWEQLPPQIQNHLQQFLPQFGDMEPKLAAIEQSRTLKMFFQNDLERFGQTPLSQFQRELEIGNYRPDVLKLRQNVHKSKRREQRFQECEYISQLAKQLFLSKQRILQNVYHHQSKSSPPSLLLNEKMSSSSTTRVSSNMSRSRDHHHHHHEEKEKKEKYLMPTQHTNFYNDHKLSAIRARKRFHGEIKRITMELGLKNGELSSSDEIGDYDDDDDDDDEMMVMKAAGQSKGDGNGLHDSISNDLDDNVLEVVKSNPNHPSERCIFNTLFERQINLDDELANLQQQKKQFESLNNKNFQNHLKEHKRRKLTEPTRAEFEISDIRLRDVCVRAQLGGNFKRLFAMSKIMARKSKLNNHNRNHNNIPKVMMTMMGGQGNTMKNMKMDTSSSIDGESNQLKKPFELPALVPILQPSKQQDEKVDMVNPSPNPMAASNVMMMMKANPQKASKVTTTSIAMIGPNEISSTPPLLQGIIKEEQQQQMERNKMKAFAKEMESKASSPGLEKCSYANKKPCPDIVIRTMPMAESSSSSSSTLLPPPAALLTTNDVVQEKDTSSLVMDNTTNLYNRPTIKTMMLASDVRTSEDSIPSNSGNNSIYNQLLMPKLEPISSSPPSSQETTTHPHHHPHSSPMKLTTSTTTTTITKKHHHHQSPPASSVVETAVVLNETSASIISGLHASYFSLIRDLFCSTANHRMRYDELRMKIENWQRNPIITSNDWYCLTDNWLTPLRSAINFLIGDFMNLPDEYVPFIEHKSQINIYQWIGAGRDSDQRLATWCSWWFEKRKQTTSKKTSSSSSTAQKLRITTENSGGVTGETVHNNASTSSKENPVPVPPPPPPPPRYPTNWTVRPATTSEMEEFQRQERERFERPHKSYTYRMYGYESVVGPVKGIYSPMLALTKARGHSMMIGNRPNFVTILTLVRDATARLPNGEGTRADISELLKCSQYINRDAVESVLQTIVSGALDRMHTENDPCVRYDSKRKIWIYLHRDRSEEEFERIHQQNQSIAKPKKLGNARKSSSKQTRERVVDVVTTTGGGGNPLITMPALVPANNNSTTTMNVQSSSSSSVNESSSIPAPLTVMVGQPPPQLARISGKCLPPVPPLKYNIPSSSSILSGSGGGNIQQSMQSPTPTPIPIQTQKPFPIMNPSRIENKLTEMDKKTESIVTVTMATTNNNNKQSSSPLLIPQKRTTTLGGSIGGPSTSTTPILVATPQGLQTVHVVNVNPALLMANNKQLAKGTTIAKSVQQQQLEQTKLQQLQPETEQSASLLDEGGSKRLTMAKPITINQVNLVNSGKSAILSPKVFLNESMRNKLLMHQTNPMMTQLVSSSSSSSSSSNLPDVATTATIPLTSEVTSSYYSTLPTTVVGLTSGLTSSLPSTTTTVEGIPRTTTTSPLTNSKNIIRLVAAGTNVKSLLNTAAASGQILAKSPRHILSSSSSAMLEKVLPSSHHHQTATIDNLLLGGKDNNNKPPTFNLTGSSGGVINVPPPSSSSSSSIKMAAVAAGQGYINLVPPPNPLESIQVKNPSQHVILGTNSSSKNILIQKVSSSNSSPLMVNSPSTTTSLTTMTTTKILPTQQPKMLLQNVKIQQQPIQQQQQQQIQLSPPENSQLSAPTTMMMQSIPLQIKSVQMVGGGGSSTSIANVVCTPPQQLSNFARIIKASPLKTLERDTSTGGQQRFIPVSANPANCQIVSLENLLQKQGGALRLRSCLPTIVKRATAQSSNVVPPPPPPASGNSVVVMEEESPPLTGNSNTKHLNPNSNVVTQLANPLPANLSRLLASGGGGTTTAKIINKSGVPTGNIRVFSHVGAQMAGGNLNFVTLQGKQVRLASATPSKSLINPGAGVVTVKAAVTPSSSSSQTNNVSLANTNFVIGGGGQGLKLQQARNLVTSSSSPVSSNVGNINNSGTLGAGNQQQQQQPPLHTVILGNQVLRVQPIHHPVVATNRVKLQTASSPQATTETFEQQGIGMHLPTSSTNTGGPLISQNLRNDVTRVRLATSGTPANANRVVLAVQGGGQIFLTPNLAANNGGLKAALGNMKVVSLGPGGAAAQMKSDFPKAATTTMVNAIETNTSAEGVGRQ